MKYKSLIGPCSIGGVDHNGTPHEPLKFGEGTKDIPDDQQEYAQTLKSALEAGAIAIVETPARGRKEK